MKESIFYFFIHYIITNTKSHEKQETVALSRIHIRYKSFKSLYLVVFFLVRQPHFNFYRIYNYKNFFTTSKYPYYILL